MLNSDSDDSDIWRFLAVNVQQFTNLTLDSCFGWTYCGCSLRVARQRIDEEQLDILGWFIRCISYLKYLLAHCLVRLHHPFQTKQLSLSVWCWIFAASMSCCWKSIQWLGINYACGQPCLHCAVWKTFLLHIACSILLSAYLTGTLICSLFAFKSSVLQLLAHLIFKKKKKKSRWGFVFPWYALSLPQFSHLVSY